MGSAALRVPPHTQSCCLATVSPARWGHGGTRSQPSEPRRVGRPEGAALVRSPFPAPLPAVPSAWQQSGTGCAAFGYSGTEMINAGIIPACPPAPVCLLRAPGGTGELRCGRGSLCMALAPPAAWGSCHCQCQLPAAPESAGLLS